MQSGESGESKTRACRRDRNRTSILDCARELIIERGAENLSLREVAARAGYSPAGLYRYFRDKDELIEATAEQSLSVLSSYFAQEPAREPGNLPPAEQVAALGLRYLDFARDAPEQFTLIFTRLQVPFETWEQFVRTAWPFSVLAEAVRRGVEAGEFTTGPDRGADEIAYACWAFVHGLAMLRLTRMRGVEADFDRMHGVLVRAWVDSLTIRG